jgi:hypothetical protein
MVAILARRETEAGLFGGPSGDGYGRTDEYRSFDWQTVIRLGAGICGGAYRIPTCARSSRA